MAENTENKEKIVPLSIRVRQEDKDNFLRIQEELGVGTQAEAFNNIVEHYYLPIRTNQESMESVKRLKGELAAAEAKAADLQRQLDEARSADQAKQRQLDDLRRQLDEARGTANSNAQQAEQQRLELQQQMDSMVSLKDGQVVVSLTPDNLKVLDFVAARESQRRKQQWSRSHVINFFIYERFVRGKLNGDLLSVDDADLRRLGINLKAKPSAAAIEI